ncbi:hypothetical protein LTR36_001114 [Oleoguttula mirabilis]|uniref:Uncharacterized protein n=1 Tax=Oleoguttula mirabilis TaxID=1507867 RepID=A0AAV9JQ00_9PEZI|nr:hypothetical protein LTR36_001114 [Oleoguttula mirabilis]
MGSAWSSLFPGPKTHSGGGQGAVGTKRKRDATTTSVDGPAKRVKSSPGPESVNSTSTITQASQAPKPSLLGMPAEIQNEIFRYVVTSDKPIAMRMETKRTGTGMAYRVRPGLSAFTKVCRELRSTTPSLYYGSNIFYFTDSFFRQGAFEALYRRRGKNIRFMERVMARHSGAVTVREMPDHIRGTNLRSFHYNASFSACLEADGVIAISKCVARRKLLGEEDVCTCVLEELAAARSTTKEVAVQNGALFMFLLSYGNSLEEYSPETSLEDCRDCGKLMAS